MELFIEHISYNKAYKMLILSWKQGFIQVSE